MNKIVKLISVLCVLAMLLLAVTACSGRRRGNEDETKDSATEPATDPVTDPVTEPDDSPILPDYPPMETDPGLETIPDDNETSAPSSSSSVNITYVTTFTLDKSDKQLLFQYANPSKSNQNVMLIIKVSDVEIARSALIPPGNKLTTLDVTDEAINRLVEGGYKAELLIGFYDPETNEKAMVDTKALITVNVQE